MELLQKIKQDIADRIITKRFGHLPNSGRSTVEYDYSYHRSNKDDLKDYYFVVSKFIDYKSGSISDFGKRVYIYDKEGNFIEDSELQKMCRGGFFRTLTDF